jgi:hypothetical protein
MSNIYGSSSADKEAKRIKDCRDITKSIIDFGVDDSQILTIIRLLALEMEDYTVCVKIAEFVKSLGNSCVIIEKQEENNG